jgi:hypothetical protein
VNFFCEQGGGSQGYFMQMSFITSKLTKFTNYQKIGFLDYFLKISLFCEQPPALNKSSMISAAWGLPVIYEGLQLDIDYRTVLLKHKLL